MELIEVKRVLEENFSKELSEGRKRNIVFWYDDEAQFIDDIDELDIPNVKMLKLNHNNYFYIKYALEHEDLTSNYLVYAPFSKPAPRENYLLDIEKYSQEFSAEKSVSIMRDLGVADDALRPTFKKYIKFFNNKERSRVFKSYSLVQYTEELVDVAVMSALCKLPLPDFEDVVKALLSEYAVGKSALYENIVKFGDIKAFWFLIEKHYGYPLNQQDMETLSMFFMVTGLACSPKINLPKSWSMFISLERNDVAVFLNHFMMSGDTSRSFNLLSQIVAEKLRVSEFVADWNIDDYAECDIFAVFDSETLKYLNDKLLTDIGEFAKYKSLIDSRRTKHWFSLYEYDYNTVYYASELLEQWKKHQNTITESDPYSLFEKYRTDYYKIDMAYRKFIFAYDHSEHKDRLTELKDKIENVYVNGYINTLSVNWTQSITTLQEHWGMDAAALQWQFYKRQIKPRLKKDDRVFVIISDALRYEAAKELTDILNAESKGSADISAMQGVLPSYTKLGMASLLPYEAMQINEDYGISIDGVSAESTVNRAKILANAYESSIAVQYKDIVDLKREDFRKVFQGKELIYIYHDCIDARGDHKATEREIFDAVEESLKQIKDLVTSLVNGVTATNIYIVADHGFIYKRGDIVKSEKTSKEKSDDSYESTRFILSNSNDDMEGTLSFNMQYILGEEANLKCITPKGINRFEKQGADKNYVHGGSSLQEIVIPLIKFKNIRDDKGKPQKVKVTLTSITRKLTNVITYLEFYQTEKIEDKTVPVRLNVYFEDSDGNKVTNEVPIIADSRSDDPAKRTFREKFVLKNIPYSRDKSYYLILEDGEETVRYVYDKIPFQIDLIISNQFGF